MNDKPRQGGAHSLKGFSFQAAIALVRLTWLLTCRNGTTRLRYDGAQDIDIGHSNGTEVFIQAKDYDRGNFKVTHLYDALAGFCRDTISAEANKKPWPRFRIMLTDVPIQDDVARVIRRAYLKPDAIKVAALVDEKYRRGKTDKEVRDIAARVLQEAEYVVCFGDDPRRDLISIASMELIRFGVAPRDVDTCVDRLLQGLVPGATYHLEDVAERLTGLPTTHPAARHASISVLPGQTDTKGLGTIRAQFYTGARIAWPAITANLDVRRNERRELEREIYALFRTGGMVLATGVAGSGKSTLVRRIAWDMHHHGKVIVLEAQNPDQVNEEHWTHIESLMQLSGRPFVIIVDDVWRSRSFVEGFDRISTSRLCLLGTSRPGERYGLGTVTFPVKEVSLGPITDDEFEALRQRLDKQSTYDPDVIDHARQKGQILLLALLLQNHSIEQFADSVLAPLKPTIKDIYLDICVGVIYDVAMPLSVMNKIEMGGQQLWRDEALNGLVFETPPPNARVNAGHSVVARAVITASKTQIVPRAIRLCTLCRYEDETERRYAIKLLECLVNDKDWHDACKAHAHAFEQEADRLAEHAGYLELHRVSTLLKRISSIRAAEKLLRLAEPGTVREGPDIALFMSHHHKTFATNFEVPYSFYSRHQTRYARRNFVNLTRQLGSREQKNRTAEMMKDWLRANQFPLAESLAVFSLLTNSGKELAQRHADVLAEYLDTHALTEVTALAAIRFTEIVKDRHAFERLYTALTAVLVSGALHGNEKVAIHLARPAERLLPVTTALYDILRGLIARRSSKKPSVALIAPAVHLAPLADLLYFQRLIESMPLYMRGRRSRNVEQMIQRRLREAANVS